MSAVLELTQEPPREVWLISRDEPVRKKVWLTSDEEEKIINSSRYEIVDGELYERPMPNPKHGRIQARIATEMNLFLKSQNLGAVYTETHFQLTETLTRVPDVAFISFERFPEGEESEGSKWLVPPDLAVEINSPSDDHESILRKIQDYFSAGVQQVWLVEPEFKIVTVYYSFTNTAIFTEAQEIVCEDILPGFHLKLSDIFQKPTRN